MSSQLNTEQRVQVEARFGQRVRTLRMAQSLRLEDLATAVTMRLAAEGGRRVSMSYLSKIENGRLAPPSVVVILQLASVLSTDPDDLLALAGKASPDLARLLAASAQARAFFRQAHSCDLTENEWKALARQLPERIPIVTPLHEIDDQTVAVELRGIIWTVCYRPDVHGWPFYHTAAEQGGRHVTGHTLHYNDPCHELAFSKPPAWLAEALPNDGVEGMFIEERDEVSGRFVEVACVVLPRDVRMQLRHWVERHNERWSGWHPPGRTER